MKSNIIFLISFQFVPSYGLVPGVTAYAGVLMKGRCVIQKPAPAHRAVLKDGQGTTVRQVGWTAYVGVLMKGRCVTQKPTPAHRAVLKDSQETTVRQVGRI